MIRRPPISTRSDKVCPYATLCGSSDEGYGFIARLGDLESRQKAGKAVINVSATANVLAPARVADTSTDRLELVTAEGRLLVFPLAELPELAKGKGNKPVALKDEHSILASWVLPAAGSGKEHA